MLCCKFIIKLIILIITESDAPLLLGPVGVLSKCSILILLFFTGVVHVIGEEVLGEERSSSAVLWEHKGTWVKQITEGA